MFWEWWVRCASHLLSSVQFRSLIPHTILQASYMARIDTAGQRVGFRYFYSLNLGGYTQLMINNWTALVIALSIVFLWLNYSYCMSESPSWDTEYSIRDYSWQYRLVKRFHLVIHVVRCVNGLRECLRLKVYQAGWNGVWNHVALIAILSQDDLRRGLQTVVSQNKRRFIDSEAKLDLDLTYICDRVIAMALPCVDGALHRNNIREVAKFFSSRHYGL